MHPTATSIEDDNSLNCTHYTSKKKKLIKKTYVDLYDATTNVNGKRFLVYHLLRELELLYNGNLHEVIYNFAHFGFTTTIHVEKLKDPFYIF